MNNRFISMGLDLSTTATGVVILDNNFFILHQGLIVPRSKKDEEKQIVYDCEKIIFISNTIKNLIKQNKPDIVVIEGFAYGIRDTRSIFQNSGLSWIIRMFLYESKINTLIVQPTQLKKFITGVGKGKKELILLKAFQRYNIEFKTPDEAEAYGLAKIGMLYLFEKKKCFKKVICSKSFEQEVLNKCLSEEAEVFNGFKD